MLFTPFVNKVIPEPEKFWIESPCIVVEPAETTKPSETPGAVPSILITGEPV